MIFGLFKRKPCDCDLCTKAEYPETPSYDPMFNYGLQMWTVNGKRHMRRTRSLKKGVY